MQHNLQAIHKQRAHGSCTSSSGIDGAGRGQRAAGAVLAGQRRLGRHLDDAAACAAAVRVSRRPAAAVLEPRAPHAGVLQAAKHLSDAVPPLLLTPSLCQATDVGSAWDLRAPDEGHF